jgi:polar amino acid transport system substrate-binding protein
MRGTGLFSDPRWSPSVKKSSLAISLGLCLQALAAQSTLTLSSFGDPNDPAMAPTAKWAMAAFKDAGYDLVLDYKPGERALIDANEGIDDGDLSRIKGIEATYTNLIMVPEPLTNLNQVAYATRKLNASSIDELAKIGASAVVLIGNKIMDGMVKPKLAPEKYYQVADLALAFKMLMAGRVDVLLVSDVQAKTWLALPENAAAFPLFQWHHLSTYTFLHKKWASAVPKIAASYKKLRK